MLRALKLIISVYLSTNPIRACDSSSFLKTSKYFFIYCITSLQTRGKTKCVYSLIMPYYVGFVYIFLYLNVTYLFLTYIQKLGVLSSIGTSLIKAKPPYEYICLIVYSYRGGCVYKFYFIAVLLCQKSPSLLALLFYCAKIPRPFWQIWHSIIYFILKIFFILFINLLNIDSLYSTKATSFSKALSSILFS